VQGDQRGRLLGFPTANVEVPNFVCLPADGVYAGWYGRPGGSRHPCAINLGRRPTFYEHADHSLLEAHLLDFQGDLYGERAQVEFTHFLRSERKFDGVDALIAQLAHDIDHARSLLSG
jgi:riboflavin kinase/FMN adenylyltransferase